MQCTGGGVRVCCSAVVRVCFVAGVRVCCSSCQDVSRRRDRSWQEAIKQLKIKEMFTHGRSIGQCRRQYLYNIAQLES